MYSNKLSAVQSGKNHSIFNAQFLKESVMKLTNVFRTNAIRVACVILSSAPITMVAVAAQAGESADAPRHMVVSFRDLNLSSTEGIAVLYKRIKRAAQEVCGDWDSTRLSQIQSQSCVNDAVSRAIAQVNNPMLTSLYRTKTGKTGKQEPKLAQAH
jgi:UrcA family protein